MYENVQECLQIRFPFGLAKIQHFKYYKIVYRRMGHFLRDPNWN